MKKGESFIVRILKGWGYLAASTVMNLWFVTVLIVFAGKSLFVKLLIGIAALIIVNGLFFNYSYNCAKKDRDLIRYHGKERDRFMPLKMSLIVPAFHYIVFIVLCLCKAGIVTFENSDHMLGFYATLKMHTLPWIAMFTEGRTMEYLTLPGILGLLLIDLIEPAVISLTYILTLNDVDIKKFIYKK